MTNSKSVDNHSFMTNKSFVMMNSTYSWIDKVKKEEEDEEEEDDDDDDDDDEDEDDADV